jgi:hypothetical protein
MEKVLPIEMERRSPGRRLHFDGQEWAVLYTDAAERVTLPAAGLNFLLQALRAGTVVLQTDAETIAAQPRPADRDKAVREWLLLDATIAGARAHDAPQDDALDLLERRLATATEYLGPGGVDPSAVRSVPPEEQAPGV